MDLLSDPLARLVRDNALFSRDFGSVFVISGAASSSVDVSESRECAIFVEWETNVSLEVSNEISNGMAFAVSFADSMKRSRCAFAQSRAFLRAVAPCRNVSQVSVNE